MRKRGNVEVGGPVMTSQVLGHNESLRSELAEEDLPENVAFQLKGVS